ncbi:Ornithine carbamoyltransferase [Candidatus Bilamarchaeum dharawalense]|uniref:Ornithine carbamoyltransferase n=1 Tax=Candidatus Bilamarchaeum dharawalense TaxID=2885759 RepID=A0A5E4LP14_9ARCH|nr:Ornithine carbamoyltransferase [Candidatus Bilamarchaeum dharawalense]
MNHVLYLKEYDGKWIESVVDLALDIKKHPSKYTETLKHKTLAMIFQKTSTRTRLSFETGMTKLGGHAIYIDWRTTQLAMGGVQDEAKVISSYDDAIMVRPLKHATLVEMVKGSKVPVINGLCEKYHPCQALADVMTIKEKLGKLKGVKVVYTGIGNNVSNSLSYACVTTGADFTLSVPEVDPDSIDEEKMKKVRSHKNYHENPKLEEAVKGADVIYTDTWVNMEFFSDPKFASEKERREKAFLPYQLNKKLMEIAGPQAHSMHDMPAHIGYEIDEFGLRGPRSLAFTQAENRMWAQMALLIKLIGEK